MRGGYVSEPYIALPPEEGEGFLPVSLAEVKLWAKVFGNAEDDLLTMLIEGVTLEVERYTKREISLKRFRTYRDDFGDFEETPIIGSARRYSGFPAPVTLRRTPLQSIESISYLKDGSYIALDLDKIDIIDRPDFSQFVPATGEVFPSVQCRPQAVIIEFSAGYPNAGSVPADLKSALLAHITSLYQNRGDCDSGGGSSCSCKYAPAQSLAVYNGYRIIDFRA